MPNELTLRLPTLLGFLLVLARVSGAMAFVPMPGHRNTPVVAKAVLVLGITLTLLPRWPQPAVSGPLAGQIMVWLLQEAALGLTIGLVVSVVTECLLLSFQLLGLQAGYTFASTIDPTTEADSSVFQIFGQLLAGFFFFAFGLHREVLRAFAASLESYPPGSFTLGAELAPTVVSLTAGLFSAGFRLALPVMASLMLVDLALALMSRINAQLQLLQIAFPAKMLVALFLLAWVLVVVVRVYERYLLEMLGVLRSVMRY
ncbi:MAG: flagellar biosynthetic protein FliR [Bryobacterales bacterium]|nr:flagellar biosynthetic protein FliR [Bryobacterales bacterium]